MSILINQIKIKDVYGNEIVDPAICDNFSIGKSLTVEVYCEVPAGYSVGLDDAEFFICPAMFGDAGSLHPEYGSQPSKAWLYDHAGIWGAGFANHAMTLQGCGINTQRNVNLFWRIVDSGAPKEFIISTTFVLTCDLADFITGYAIDNQTRLLKNNFYNPIAVVSGPVSNTFPSVYNQEKELILYVFVRLGDESTIYDYIRIPWSSRFNKKGLLNTAPELTMAVELSRDGLPVTNLSAYDPTKVKLKAKMNGNTVVEMEVRVFRFDGIDNIQPFLTDLEASTQFTGNVGGKFINPTTALNIVGDDVDASWTIDPGSLDPAGKYYVMGIFYFEDGTKTNTVISTQYTADDAPNPCPISIEGRIKDYVRENTDNVITVVKDRLLLEIDLDPADFDSCVATHGYPYGAFQDILQELIVIITRESDGQLIFTSGHAVQANFGITNMTTVWEGGILKVRWYIRNEFENFQSIDTWGGETFYIDYNFIVLPDLPGIDDIHYIYRQRLFVLDSDNYRAGLEVIESIELYNAGDGMPLSTICDVETVLVKVKIAPGHADKNWHLLAFIDTYPFGITIYNDWSLRERESFPSPQGLPSYSAVQLLDVDVQTFAGVAFFKVPASYLVQYVNYRVSAIVKEIDSACDSPDMYSSTMGESELSDMDISFMIDPGGVANYEVWFTKQYTDEAGPWPLVAVTGTVADSSVGAPISVPGFFDTDLYENLVLKVEWQQAGCPDIYTFYWIYKTIGHVFELAETILVAPEYGPEIMNWTDRVNSYSGDYNQDDTDASWHYLNFISGFRTKIVRDSLITGSNLQAAIVPLIVGNGLMTLGNDIDTNNGFLIGDYSRVNGLGDTGNIGKYLDLTFAANVGIPQDDNSISFFSATSLSTNTHDDLCVDGSTNIRMLLQTNFPSFSFKVNDNSVTQTGGGVSDTHGFFMMARENDMQQKTYVNGRLATTSAAVSGSVPTGNIFLMKGATDYGRRKCFGYHIGQALDADEAKLMYIGKLAAFRILGRW